MGAMMPMRHKMEFSFINSISESLYDDGWPSRLMALQLLSVAQGAEFKPVLEWKAKEDTEEIVRKFAQAKIDLKFESHAIPEIQEKQLSDTESKELIAWLHSHQTCVSPMTRKSELARWSFVVSDKTVEPDNRRCHLASMVSVRRTTC